MLIDDLINGPIINLPRADTMKFKNRLREAMKFELSPDFAAAAEALADNFTNVAKAIPFCRLPFKSCWIELVQNDRPRFSAADIHIPELQSKPKRIGFLLEATDEKLSAFRAHQFWSFPPEHNVPPNISELAMLYEPEKIKVDPDYKDSDNRNYFKIESSPMWKKSTPEVRSMLTSVIRPDAPDFPTSWEMAQAEGEKEISKMSFEVSVTDWSGESVYVLAVLALLNTRNASVREQVSMSKINKKRAASGRYELQEYHVLKIHPRVKARMVQAGGGRGGSMELAHHIVRGHWKVRRTGVFWWHPFWRGDPEKGKVEKGYQVD